MGIISDPRPTGMDLVQLTVISNQAAATDFAKFVAPFSGVATIQISLATGSVVNLSATDVAGDTAVVSSLDSGSSITAGQWTTLQFGMSAGATYALQVATAQSGNLAVSIEGAAS